MDSNKKCRIQIDPLLSRKIFTAETKRKLRGKYLSPLVKGQWVSAVSFTEPDHGSDLTRMNTTLEEKEDGFMLRCTKIFTTNASYADFFVLLAQDDQAASPGKGMTTISVERDPASWLSGGMEVNEIPHKMGIRTTSSGEVIFHDLKVPKENVVGERGKGLRSYPFAVSSGKKTPFPA